MKSSQFMARLETAGWRRIRSDGSHFTYEHPRHGRVMYAYGRPQTEIGKHTVRELEARFKLKELEHDKQALRAAQAATVHVRSVPTTPTITEPEMTDKLARLYYSQLHHDHKITMAEIAKATKVKSGDLTDYFHRQRSLKTTQEVALWTWLREQAKKYDLASDHKQLRTKGWGVRAGSVNTPDPWLEQAREILVPVLEKVKYQTDLAESIGVPASVLGSIINRKVKRIYPVNKAKIQHWIEMNYGDDEMRRSWERGPDGVIPTEPTPQTESELKPEPEIILPTKGDADPELIAIQEVWEAIRGLKGPSARRILQYVTDRLTD